VGSYLAKVDGYSDYYPFGMLMPGRDYHDEYRFGYNGKEKDNEVAGDGNEYDYKARIYDPRIAKFLSVDALQKKFAMLTPYQFASNIPISGIDLDGLEYYFAADGTFLGNGKNVGSTEVRITESYKFDASSNHYAIYSSKTLDLSISQFMDRIHMVYGEGGGNGLNKDGQNPALYFAWAFENFKQSGLSKPLDEETAKNKTWKDSKGSYAAGTIKTSGNATSPYNTFNAIRKDVEGQNSGGAEKFNNADGVKNVAAQIISVLLKTSTDPTDGAYQWSGGYGTGDDNGYWTGKPAFAKGTVPTAKIDVSTKWFPSYTVFYKFAKKDDTKKDEKPAKTK
jgi:RHS repeat-associated protein